MTIAIAITLGVQAVATILTTMFKADRITPNAAGLAFLFGV